MTDLVAHDGSVGGAEPRAVARRWVRARTEGAPRRQRDVSLIVARLGAYVCFIVMWQVLATSVFGTATLPTPGRVWDEILEIFREGLFWPNFVATTRVFLIAFVIAFAVGTALGILMGRIRYFDTFFRDGVTAILGTPGIVFIMVCLVVWGLSPWGRIIAVVIGTVPIVTINVIEGVRAIPRDLLDMGSAYGVSRARQLRHTIWPAIAPFVFAGARYGLAVGFKGTAMVEVFGGSEGMGFQLRTQFINFSVAGTLAWTALIVAIVLLLELVVLKNAERRFFRWRRAAFT
jgi:NitT/TauT family transport system permease protein